MRRSIAVLVLMAVLFAGFGAGIGGASIAKTKLRARLKPTAASTVRGAARATYLSRRGNRTRLQVLLRAVLAPGTKVSLSACGADLGDFTLEPGPRGQSIAIIKLGSGKGHTLPLCMKGDVIRATGSGLVIEGTFRGFPRSD